MLKIIIQGNIQYVQPFYRISYNFICNIQYVQSIYRLLYKIIFLIYNHFTYYYTRQHTLCTAMLYITSKGILQYAQPCNIFLYTYTTYKPIV